MLPLYGSTVTVRRIPDAVDQYGDKVTDQGLMADVGTYPAHVQPDGASESKGDPGRPRASAAGFRVWLDLGADVRKTDTVLWNGRTLEVDGEPQVWAPGFGISYQEVHCSTTRG